MCREDLHEFRLVFKQMSLCLPVCWQNCWKFPVLFCRWVGSSVMLHWPLILDGIWNWEWFLTLWTYVQIKHDFGTDEEAEKDCDDERPILLNFCNEHEMKIAIDACTYMCNFLCVCSSSLFDSTASNFWLHVIKKNIILQIKWCIFQIRYSQITNESPKNLPPICWLLLTYTIFLRPVKDVAEEHWPDFILMPRYSAIS